MAVGNNGLLDGIRQIPARFRALDILGGLPGAPLGFRLRGATASGHPVKGTWRTGDMIPDRTGAWWTCTAGGSPGTWATAAGSGLPGVVDIGANGGTGTNTAADTTLIQSLINAAPAGSTIFFDKLYTVSSTIQFAGGLAYLGINQATGLQAANSSNLDALAAPVGWAANTATQGSTPVTIRDMYFGGPPSVPQASGTGHLLVMNNYWSYVEDCTFGYNIGQGIRLDACTANGTQIISGGGAVQNRIHRCQFYQNNGGSLASNDPSGAFTDGYVTDCIFEAGTGVNPAIGMGTFAGWKVDGNHFFGYDGSVIVGRPYETRVVNNYFETWGDSATSDYYTAVDFGSVFVADGGAGSVIAGNTFNLGDAGNAGSTLIAIAVAAASGEQATVAVTGNQLAGPTGTITGTFYGITLNGQDSTSTVVATVSGNSFSGEWNGAQVFMSNEDSSATTNFTVTGDLNAQCVVLATTFTSASSTSAQNVTGMAAPLTPGSYILHGVFYYTPAGTVGDTDTFAWTFGGTASSAVVNWMMVGASGTATNGGGTTITASGTSPAKTGTTASRNICYFDAHVAISAAGTLQLTVANVTAGGDEISITAGSCLTVQPVAY